MSTLVDSHRLLAYQFSQQNCRRDANRDWHDAEFALVRTNAYFRSTHTDNVKIGDVENWLIATRTIRWREHLEAIQHDCFVPKVHRPYLALAATRSTSALCSDLERISPLNGTADSIAFVAVLDGAPEAARFHLGKDNDREYSKVMLRDERFFEYCRLVLALANGSLLERGELCSPDSVLVDDRAFQDGCIGTIKNDQTQCGALAAALSLRAHLVSFNYRSELAWQHQLHARIVIATSWHHAIRGLVCAYRDDVVVEDSVISRLSECSQRILLSSGIRLLSAKID